MTHKWTLTHAIGIAVLLGMLVAVLCRVTARADPILRTVDVGASPYAVAVDARANRALVASGPAFGSGRLSLRVTVLDAISGEALHAADIGGKITPSFTGSTSTQGIAIDPRTAHAFVASSFSDSVSMLDARSGQILKTIPLPGGPSAVAVVPQTGRVFVSSSRTNTVTILDSESGTIVRTIALGSGALAVDGEIGHVFIADGSGDTVSTLDARTGDVVRTTHIGRYPGNLVVDVRSGRVFVPIMQGNSVGVLDARSGRLVRMVPTGREPTAVVVDARINRVFVVATGGGRGRGSVDTLDATRGTLLRTIPLRGIGMPKAAAVNERTGHVLITDEISDTVTVLDAAHGAILQTAPMGGLPLAISVDERSARVFVVNFDVGAGKQTGVVGGVLARIQAFLGRGAERASRGTVSVLNGHVL